MTIKTFKIDRTHSNIGFNVKHMMFSKISGHFQQYDASIELSEDDFENAQLRFEAQSSSITTNNEKRDAHLKTTDFFNTVDHKLIKFTSTAITKRENNLYLITGDLTINGVIHPVRLATEYSGILQDPWGNDRIALVIKAKINRKNWNINWNQTLQSGGVMVSEHVNFDIDAQFI